jgi:hypothetical protein
MFFFSPFTPPTLDQYDLWLVHAHRSPYRPTSTWATTTNKTLEAHEDGCPERAAASLITLLSTLTASSNMKRRVWREFETRYVSIEIAASRSVFEPPVVQFQADWKPRKEHRQSSGFLSARSHESGRASTSNLDEVCSHPRFTMG